MTRYVLRKLLWSAGTLAGMSVVAFLLAALAPGDPATAELRFLGVPANPDTVEALRKEFDLDAPLPERCLRWAGRLVTLNLGKSIASGRPVLDELGQALPPTLTLAAASLALIVLLSLATGAVRISLEMGSIVVAFSTLSFLGLVLQPPNPEWGVMLNEARPFVSTAPHLLLGPGLALIFSVLSCNLLAEGLRERLDSRQAHGW